MRPTVWPKASIAKLGTARPELWPVMDYLQYLLAGFVGVGLAAACGLRAFVPVLGISLAAKAGWIQLGPSFEWMSSWAAIACLSVACLVELSASVLPVIAHALDALAAPVATAAGAVVMASQTGAIGAAGSIVGMPEIATIDPLLAWSAALIAGGGVAAAVHTVSATVRAGSSAISGGLLAPVYGVIESALSVIASILAVVLPVFFALVTTIVLVALIVIGVRVVRRRAATRARHGNAPSSVQPVLS